jgi:hypothetical protein
VCGLFSSLNTDLSFQAAQTIVRDAPLSEVPTFPEDDVVEIFYLEAPLFYGSLRKQE